jgi:hypothetical protein
MDATVHDTVLRLAGDDDNDATTDDDIGDF